MAQPMFSSLRYVSYYLLDFKDSNAIYSKYEFSEDATSIVCANTLSLMTNIP